MMMLVLALVSLVARQAAPASRPADIAFRVHAHSSALVDLNGDQQPDLVAAKRYFGRGGTDPSEREPMGIYWYQFRRGPGGAVDWIRHIVDYGGRAGGGLQMAVEDIDADGHRDVITAGKTGPFLSENLAKGK